MSLKFENKPLVEGAEQKYEKSMDTAIDVAAKSQTIIGHIKNALAKTTVESATIAADQAREQVESAKAETVEKEWYDLSGVDEVKAFLMGELQMKSEEADDAIKSGYIFYKGSTPMMVEERNGSVFLRTA